MSSTDLPPVLSNKRHCPDSFPNSLLSKAPRLTRCKSGSSPCCYRDLTSSRSVTLPSSDLERSQYLWPSATIKLENIASCSSMREEYKARLRQQFDCSNAFRQQFLLFVGQLMHDQHSSSPSHSRLPSSYTSSCTPYVDPSLGLVTTSDTGLSSLTVPQKDGFHHRSSILLMPPRPRLTSPLSPFPSWVPLRGTLRRPMPRSKGIGVCLLKQALCNTEHGKQMRNLGIQVALRNFESQHMPVAVYSEDVEVEDCNERLNNSWVDPPGGDWEMIDLRELAPC